MSEELLKEEYASEEACKAAIAKFNEGKKPEEEMRYCSYFNSIKQKRMYVPCSIEYFYAWRNMMAEEHRVRDLESRCLVPSERYSYFKKCMEDCSNCPYKKDKRDGSTLSLDKFAEENNYEVPNDSQLSPLEYAIEQERQEALNHAIAELSEEDLQVLNFIKEGYTDEEIGKALGLKRTTAQYRKNRVIETLRKKLKNY